MPIVQAQNIEFLSHSPDQTQRIGVRLGESLHGGDLICLTGDLGTGKTTLAQGIARGWGSFDQVTSPSFVFAHIYDGETPLYHIDLYRVEKEEELPHIGVDEMLGNDGVAVVEWFDRFPAIWPGEKLEVHMEFGLDEERKISLRGLGDRGQELVGKFKEASW